MIDIETIQKDISGLPPFRHTVLKARQMINDSSVSAEQLTNVLKYDVGITTNILRCCNSPYYGLRQRVTNLQQAIVLLGYKELRHLLILSGSMKYFNGSQPGYESNYGELWQHSITTASLAEIIGNKVGDSDNDLFVTGLMHDVGKLILSRYVENEYEQISEMVSSQEVPFHVAENAILGTNHAEVGGRLLSQWNFPETIVRATANHHEVKSDDNSRVTWIIALADRLASIMGAGTLSDGLTYQDTGKIRDYFGFSPQEIDEIISLGADRVNTITHILAA